MAAQAVGKIEFNRMGPDQLETDACFHRPEPFVVPRRKPLVIGFGHEAQQGKDTIVNHLVATYGHREPGVWGKAFPLDARRYAFADPLKIEVFDWLQGAAFGLHGMTAFLNETSWEEWQHRGTKKLVHINRSNGVPYPLPFADRIYTRAAKLAWVNANKTELRELLQFWGTEYRRAQLPEYWARETQIKIDYDAPQVAFISDLRFLNETEICDYRIRVVRKGFAPVGGSHVSEQELKDFKYHYVIEAESVEELKMIGEATFEQILIIKGLK